MIWSLRNFSCSVFCVLHHWGWHLFLYLLRRVTVRFPNNQFGSLSDAHSRHWALLIWPGLSLWSGWPSQLTAWRGIGNVICCLPHPCSPTPSNPQPYPKSAFFPDLLNCFECCGKWIILKWKPGQIWFGLETTQGFKRSQLGGTRISLFSLFSWFADKPERKTTQWYWKQTLVFLRKLENLCWSTPEQ